MRVGFISLGCAKNQVDCEQMMFRMREAGHEILADPDGADLVIVNTCGFIDAAKREAIDNILAMGRLKEEGRIKKILVTGCLAQRYQEEILQEMPEVDGVLGTGSYYDVVSAAKQVMEGRTVSEFGSIHTPLDGGGRILTTPAHYAWLKIAEGCSNCCAYCVIPKLRGRYRSRGRRSSFRSRNGRFSLGRGFFRRAVHHPVTVRDDRAGRNPHAPSVSSGSQQEPAQAEI